MMNNLLMPQAAPAPAGMPPGMPQGAPAVDPQQIADARAHLGVVLQGLMGLAAKPRGSLSKRDLFNAVGDMIADGAFSTPQAKQQLVAELAGVPDDESAIRQAVGGHLMRLAQAQDMIHQHFGPGE